MWSDILNLLWPAQCVCGALARDSVCPYCAKQLQAYPLHCLICEATSPKGATHRRCLHQARGITHTCVIWKYHTAARSLIRSWKYHGSNTIRSQWLKQQVSKRLKASPWIDAFSRSSTVTIVPVPMSQRRRQERGWNPPELIAQWVADAFNSRQFRAQVDTTFVSRQLQQSHQAGSSVAQRALLIRNNFQINRKIKPQEQLVLVDDVLSTGSTVLEIARLCKPKPVTLGIMALARG